MRVGIIGGGMMGMFLGYFLTQKGIEVEIFEGAQTLGGLANSITLEDGTIIDRFYHTILSSDSHLYQMCMELGIADQLRFQKTRMGFFYKGNIYSMNNAIEFLRFPPLGWIDRFRLGYTILKSQFIRNWQDLESVSVEKWLLKLSGQRTYENIWRPMLKAKFDGGFENTPATYVWSRLVRMKSTRSGVNQEEKAGHLIGGYGVLIKAIAEKIEAMGAKVHLQQRITSIAIENKNSIGIFIDNQLYRFDKLVSTITLPQTSLLLSGANKEYRDSLDHAQYLGIICPIMVLDRPLTGFWTLNLTDDQYPFTGIIETTAYIDPQYVGGYHLVYLPKYTAPDSKLQNYSDDEIKELWLKDVETMFPQFDRRWLRYFVVQRSRYVEPLHPLNGFHLIPSIHTPLNNFYLATNFQIYPNLTNGESISRKAREVADLIEDDAK